MHHNPDKVFNTYSIVAHHPDTGQLGVAVQTHQICVGLHVPWLSAGVGAIATQASTNVRFGSLGLELLHQGIPAQKVIEALVASDDNPHVRQLAIVDSHGRVGAWTGENCIAEAGHYLGQGYSVQANMMTKDTVLKAMSAAYESSSGDFAERLLAVLFAAQTEGGDIRGMQSAALKIVSHDATKDDIQNPHNIIYDLRVDENPEPLQELERLVRLQRAELMDAEGYRAFEGKEMEKALFYWEQARALAPELEEMPFWQAVTLADKPADLPTAINILKPMLSQEPRKEYWIDLIRRLQDCGMIERSGAGNELIIALAVA